MDKDDEYLESLNVLGMMWHDQKRRAERAEAELAASRRSVEDLRKEIEKLARQYRENASADFLGIQVHDDLRALLLTASEVPATSNLEVPEPAPADGQPDA